MQSFAYQQTDHGEVGDSLTRWKPLLILLSDLKYSLHACCVVVGVELRHLNHAAADGHQEKQEAVGVSLCRLGQDLQLVELLVLSELHHLGKLDTKSDALQSILEYTICGSNDRLDI